MMIVADLHFIILFLADLYLLKVQCQGEVAYEVKQQHVDAMYEAELSIVIDHR